MKKADVIIVGSGIASLQLARHLRKDLNVIVLTKSTLRQSNSSLAQGGIAAAIHEDDHPCSHYLDTMEAGRYINDACKTLQLTTEAPGIIEDLIKDGCQFDHDKNGSLLLGNEGAHSYNRIVHGGGDQTGKRIVQGLISKLTGNITIYENEFVYELQKDITSRCCGVKSKDSAGETHTFSAPHVVLATGGCGQLYSYTSNTESVTGDGMTLAYLAGAEICDMEFIQFHPTLLYCEGKTKGLVSEAVRGEGAVLIDDNGERLMEHVHLLKDLAPRHVVAQTIYAHLQKGHRVYLDIRSISQFEKRFPTVSSLCKSIGLSLKDGLIPVAPGCHFSMGGIRIDDVGRTTIEGLYAIGEAASSGVHGANRLASNSLLEGLVYGKRLAQYINTNLSAHLRAESQRQYHKGPYSLPLPEKEEIQSRMMNHVGIVRSKTDLLLHKEWLESFPIDQLPYFDLSLLTIEQVKLLFMLQTSWLITCSALEREESRGGHFRSDYPYEIEGWKLKQIVQQRTLERREIDEQIKT
ncbi:L-aspartate oxidase [Halobacillus sp. BBL2006]|uniref:L-aspartate oxidase n=1 Tax=Halobacillus sp. BBL2006 TaxID=1543706 RepID=UPI0005439F78|nr:L-aspartate oxidase [Halobacillus sp. BBL2006]KHE73052.1 L-aspartate oxidase [Halobacillus sp. BBL2006]